MTILAELMETKSDTAMILSAALETRHHRDLINSFAAIRLKGQPVAEKLSKFMSELKGMSKERNDVIHALWWDADESNNLRIERMTMRNRGAFSMKMKPVSTRHLMAIFKKIQILTDEGHELTKEVRESVRTWRRKYSPPDWPQFQENEAHHQESSASKP